jgi:diadenosine tetraphosphate (Ap4A) HIT family hydrolase/catechol 2,3-dioxygenase-like lactoylglutathione lyase family enzyme
MTMMGCVICERRDGRPRDVLVELASSWVTGGRQACLPGYVCVVSRRHVIEPFELNDGGGWWTDCMLVARALNDELRPAKMNYEIHGNTVPHLHLHLYPRSDGDPFVGKPIDGGARLFERSAQDLDRLRRAIAKAASDEASHVHLTHIALPVADLDRSVDFYSRYFGFDRTTMQEYDDGVVLIRNADGFDLALKPDSAWSAPPSFLHFGFRAVNPSAVSALRKAIDRAGVEVIEEFDEAAYVSFKVRDPDGYVVETYWELPGRVAGGQGT